MQRRLCSSNVKSPQSVAMLYIFEENEAVIKMIIKGRSPTMTHVFGTHRVAFDLLFDRINRDPNILIKYVDTKKTNSQTHRQRAISHMMSGTIFYICSISSFSAQQAGEERIVAKFECIKSPGDTQSTQSARFESHCTKCRETCRWRFKSK